MWIDEHYLNKLDELPSKEKLHKRYHRNDDMNFDKFNRWWHSHVGENFNDVYSEFHKLQDFPARLKTLDYVNRIFFADVARINGEMFIRLRFYDTLTPFEDWNYSILYVDPDTNLIQFRDRIPKHKQKWYIKRQNEPIVEKKLSPYFYLLKLEGIWYSVKIPETYEKHGYTREKDGTYKYWTIIKNTPTNEKHFNFLPDEVIRKSIRKQLNHKELKQYNLKNR